MRLVLAVLALLIPAAAAAQTLPALSCYVGASAGLVFRF